MPAELLKHKFHLCDLAAVLLFSKSVQMQILYI
uniref:Uncharacterized protein n=1 Tax=Anguilla anguilla TaxID=7936 RepID=A0A0E9QLH6_ANGAN